MGKEVMGKWETEMHRYGKLKNLGRNKLEWLVGW